MSTNRPQKPSTCRNATDHGKNTLEFRHGMSNKRGLDGSEELHAMEKETSHDETDTCEKQPLLKDSVSVCLVPPLKRNMHVFFAHYSALARWNLFLMPIDYPVFMCPYSYHTCIHPEMQSTRMCIGQNESIWR